MSEVTTPRGFIGKREPQGILKTDECSIVLELGHEGKFVSQIKRLRSKPGFPEGDKLDVAVTKDRWCSPTCRRGPARLSSRCSTTSGPKSDAVAAA